MNPQSEQFIHKIDEALFEYWRQNMSNRLARFTDFKLVWAWNLGTGFNPSSVGRSPYPINNSPRDMGLLVGADIRCGQVWKWLVLDSDNKLRPFDGVAEAPVLTQLTLENIQIKG